MKKILSLLLVMTVIMLSMSVIIPVHAALNTVIAVNCGDTDPIGEFVADQKKSEENTWGYMGDYNLGPLVGVEEGSDTFGLDPQLFIDEIWVNDDLEYVFELENKTYTVELYFAECYSETAFEGGRVFDIEVEGTLVAEGYDSVVEAGGPYLADKVTHVVNLQDGVLNIKLIKQIQNPHIFAIRILEGAEAGATTAAPTTAAPTTEAPTTAAPTTQAPTVVPSEETAEPTNEPDGTSPIIYIVIAVVVIGAAAATLLAVKNKKKS